MHVVVDNVRKGKKALSAAGLSYTEADVLLEELPNVAGALGYFTGRLEGGTIPLRRRYSPIWR